MNTQISLSTYKRIFFVSIISIMLPAEHIISCHNNYGSNNIKEPKPDLDFRKCWTKWERKTYYCWTNKFPKLLIDLYMHKKINLYVEMVNMMFSMLKCLSTISRPVNVILTRYRGCSNTPKCIAINESHLFSLHCKSKMIYDVKCIYLVLLEV